VIELPLNYVYLRPENNRIHVELVESGKEDEILNNGRTAASQEALSGFLRKTEQYPALKDQIEKQGQKDPCIITHDGLLIDGNTRYVTLTDIAKAGQQRPILVAVLRKDLCTRENINEIEIDTQLAKKIHQDYVFTNRLIWQRKILKSHYTDEMITQKMGLKIVKKAMKRIHEEERMLEHIEEMMEANSDLRFSHFDKKEQALKDLDRAFLGLTAKGEAADAEQLKYSRYIAMTSELTKDHVRAIDDDFLDDFYENLDEDTEEGRILLEFTDDCKSSDHETNEVDELMGATPISHDLDAEKLFQKMNDPDKKKDDDHIEAKDTLVNALYRAAENEVNNQRRKEMYAEPAVVIKEERERLAKALDAVTSFIGQDGFKPGEVKIQLNRLLDEVIDAIGAFAEGSEKSKKQKINKIIQSTINKLQQKMHQ
jgi:hypothetical protein